MGHVKYPGINKAVLCLVAKTRTELPCNGKGIKNVAGNIVKNLAFVNGFKK